MYFNLNKFKIYYARECKLAKTQYGTAISITSPKAVSLENSSLTPRERDNNIEINELEIPVPLLDKKGPCPGPHILESPVLALLWPHPSP